MRIVIKPAGIFLLVGVLAVLLAVAVLNRPRPDVASAPSLPAPSAPASSASIAKAVRGDAKPVTVGELKVEISPTLGILKTWREAMPGAKNTVPVYAIQDIAKVADPWNVAAQSPVSEAIPENAPLRLEFWARSPDVTKCTANYEEKKPPFDKSLTQEVALSAKWKRYSLPFRATRAYEAEGSQISFHCGFAPGTVQIADIQLWHDAP